MHITMDVFEFGKDIKPNITKETVYNLVKKLYKITDFELEELNGFVDVNYRITVSTSTSECIFNIIIYTAEHWLDTD